MNVQSNPKTNAMGTKAYDGGQDFIAADFASRSMRWTGVIIALFLFYHLADLTWGWFSDDWVRGDPYNNVVVSLGNVGVAAFYIVANVALAVHIFHGTWSMFQSLGINSPKYNPPGRGSLQVSPADPGRQPEFPHHGAGRPDRSGQLRGAMWVSPASKQKKQQRQPNDGRKGQRRLPAKGAA